MKLIVDLDDVICGGGFLYLVNQYLKTNYTEDDIKGRGLQDFIPSEKLDGFNDFFSKANVYDYVTILPNALEVLKKLNDKYDLYICSSFVVPWLGNDLGLFLKFKYEWIIKNLTFVDPKKIIFMYHKSLIDADIRIDDRLSNLAGSGSIKILFTSFHSKSTSVSDLKDNNAIRVNNWLEVEELLLNS